MLSLQKMIGAVLVVASLLTGRYELGRRKVVSLFVNGTPVDCVNLGVTALLKNKPSLIVSGINNGRNIGEDVHYSGTVGAATEGFLHGITSFAFSLTLLVLIICRPPISLRKK